MTQLRIRVGDRHGISEAQMAVWEGPQFIEKICLEKFSKIALMAHNGGRGSSASFWLRPQPSGP